jgi:hypothetical protein
MWCHWHDCDGSEVDLLRQTAQLADTKTAASLRPLSGVAGAAISSPVHRARRPSSGYRNRRLKIAKLGGLPADIMPHMAAP